MRFIVLLFWFLVGTDIATAGDSDLLGEWDCGVTELVTEGNLLDMDIHHTIQFRPDGTSTDYHTYSYKGIDGVWFTVAYSGPWTLEDNTLTAITTSSEFSDASHAEILQSHELLQLLQFEKNEYKSHVVELSPARFSTIDDDSDDPYICERK
ncbi:hypothetical protein HR060_11740 [Catenovulum sp. SM1970]|uniref:hypothetical protein n=1 Tax=Marinifaba aquimaris TaxID=2741323 RepID=UPI00157182CB|nr:hypothetical protein [Marinifaba aquimaris]NTS77535.1 hypothetical protein [Marinifaba aquimaris]